MFIQPRIAPGMEIPLMKCSRYSFTVPLKWRHCLQFQKILENETKEATRLPRSVEDKMHENNFGDESLIESPADHLSTEEDSGTRGNDLGTAKALQKIFQEHGYQAKLLSGDDRPEINNFSKRMPDEAGMVFLVSSGGDSKEFPMHVLETTRVLEESSHNNKRETSINTRNKRSLSESIDYPGEREICNSLCDSDCNLRSSCSGMVLPSKRVHDRKGKKYPTKCDNNLKLTGFKMLTELEVCQNTSKHDNSSKSTLKSFFSECLSFDEKNNETIGYEKSRVFVEKTFRAIGIGTNQSGDSEESNKMEDKNKALQNSRRLAEDVFLCHDNNELDVNPETSISSLPERAELNQRETTICDRTIEDKTYLLECKELDDLMSGSAIPPPVNTTPAHSSSPPIIINQTIHLHECKNVYLGVTHQNGIKVE